MIAGGLHAEPEAGEYPDELVRQATAGDAQVEVASEDRSRCDRALEGTGKLGDVLALLVVANHDADDPNGPETGLDVDGDEIPGRQALAER
jgi:hypothetical protein